MRVSRTGRLYSFLRMARNRLIIAFRQLRFVHPTSYIHQTSSLSKDLVTEEYVFVGRNCNISPRVSIGRYSMLASDVAIVGGDHVSTVVGTPMQFTGRPPQEVTRIARDVWIGTNAIILRGVTIGEGAIVAAGSVVTKDVPEYSVVAGAPARFLKYRFANEKDRAFHAKIINGRLLSPKFASPQD